MEPNKLIILVLIPFIITGIYWLFFDHGIDKIKHPEEWKDTGTLTQKNGQKQGQNGAQNSGIGAWIQSSKRLSSMEELP